MKRLLLIAVPLAFVFAGYLFITWDPTAPKFVRIRSFKVPPHTGLHYEFLASCPFAGGKMWISLQDSTNWWATYLFDIEQRKVIGELRNAGPVFFYGDQTRLLCKKRDEDKASFTRKCRLLVEKVVSPRFLPWKPKLPSANDTEVFWLLDLKSNSATLLGNISQFKGAGSTFRPSPDFRFGFNMSTASRDKLFICDLEKKRGSNLVMDGWPAGWWDNQKILFLTKSNDFALLDVVSEKSSPLLSSNSIVAFLDEHQIDHQGQRASAFANWNGREFEFYITDTHQKWLAADSFLLKMEKPDAQLVVVSPKFKFEWSDHFDDAQRYYVYSGRERNQGSDGVFLRDLKTKTVTALAEPENANYHSIPNFYRTNVIYVHSNQLWRVDFNGSNKIRLFPPPEKR